MCGREIPLRRGGGAGGEAAAIATAVGAADVSRPSRRLRHGDSDDDDDDAPWGRKPPSDCWVAAGEVDDAVASCEGDE
jgi:hypothetical protein